MENTRQQIEKILRERFSPSHLMVDDDSGRHAGHAGASGGGHYRVEMVADQFEGLGLLAQQRLVHEALSGLFPKAIHALALKTYAPSQWKP